MNRRHFLAASCAASLAAINNTSIGNQGDKRDFYELKQYILDTEEQKNRIDTFLRDAAIPAYNRIGINDDSGHRDNSHTQFDIHPYNSRWMNGIDKLKTRDFARDAVIHDFSRPIVTNCDNSTMYIKFFEKFPDLLLSANDRIAANRFSDLLYRVDNTDNIVLLFFLNNIDCVSTMWSATEENDILFFHCVSP